MGQEVETWRWMEMPVLTLHAQPYLNQRSTSLTSLNIVSSKASQGGHDITILEFLVSLLVFQHS